jgi:hypothetical protein
MGCCSVVWTTWDHFWKNTGISGAGNAGRAKSPLRKFIWFAIFLTGLAFTYLGLELVFAKFLEYPVTTTVTMKNKNRVRFVCEILVFSHRMKSLF